MIELVLGGARSGKSRFAEQLAIETGKRKLYIATAQSLDDEMSERIRIHQKRRANEWETVEENHALANVLREHAGQNNCLLVDCLTLWVSNLLHLDSEDRWQTEKENLLQTLPTLPGHIIMVSNEVGSGIVPMGELSRRFVDEIGWLHQDISRISDRVTLITAGLPLVLKG